MTHQVQLSPLGIGAESEERTQQKGCCIAEDETGDWIWRSRGRGEDGEDLGLAHLFTSSEWPLLIYFFKIIFRK